MTLTLFSVCLFVSFTCLNENNLTVLGTYWDNLSIEINEDEYKYFYNQYNEKYIYGAYARYFNVDKKFCDRLDGYRENKYFKKINFENRINQIQKTDRVYKTRR